MSYIKTGHKENILPLLFWKVPKMCWCPLQKRRVTHIQRPQVSPVTSSEGDPGKENLCLFSPCPFLDVSLVVVQQGVSYIGVNFILLIIILILWRSCSQKLLVIQKAVCLTILGWPNNCYCSCSVNHVWLCDPLDCSTPGSPSFPISQSLLKLMSIESVMPSSHLILCCPLPLLPSVLLSIRVFSSESALHISGQSIGASASSSVLPMNIQGWFPLGLTGLIWNFFHFDWKNDLILGLTGWPWANCISLESLRCARFALIQSDAATLSFFNPGSCLILWSSVAFSSCLWIVRFLDKLCQKEVVKKNT